MSQKCLALLKQYTEMTSMFINYPFHHKVNCSRHLLKLYLENMKEQLEMSSAKTVFSVYFCTKSLYSSVLLIQKTVEHLSINNILSSDAEITVEVSSLDNINTWTLKELQQIGVNRISLNSFPSSFINGSCMYNSDLFRQLQSICLIYERVSADIDYTVESFPALLDRTSGLTTLTELGINHVTFQQHSNGDFNHAHEMSPTELECLGFSEYCHLKSLMEKLKFHQYELCNFALDCKSESMHLKGLWEGKQFIGIGPEAHGRICKYSRFPFVRFATYSTLSESKLNTSITELSELEIKEELLFLALRTTGGLRNDVWKMANNGISLQQTFSHDAKTMELVESGVLNITENHMVVSEDKLVILNFILTVLFEALYKLT